MQAGANTKTDSPEITVPDNIPEIDIETISTEITVLDNPPEIGIETISTEITVLDNIPENEQPGTAASHGNNLV